MARDGAELHPPNITCVHPGGKSISSAGPLLLATAVSLVVLFVQRRTRGRDGGSTV
ncbi:hypothetical protein ACWFMI_02690 [Nocardiopsis terrae]